MLFKLKQIIGNGYYETNFPQLGSNFIVTNQQKINCLQVEAVIGGTNLAKSNVYAYATDCFVTPTPDAEHPYKHDLLIDS